MATNIFANKPVAVTALKTVKFSAIGLTDYNILVIHRIDNPPASYIPTRAINPIDGFVQGQGYNIYAKIDMDLSEWVVPPLPDEVTIKQWVLANFAEIQHLHDIGDIDGLEAALQEAADRNKLIAGTGISIVNNVISATVQDKNFATDNLTFTGNRVHDAANYSLYIPNLSYLNFGFQYKDNIQHYIDADNTYFQSRVDDNNQLASIKNIIMSGQAYVALGAAIKTATGQYSNLWIKTNEITLDQKSGNVIVKNLQTGTASDNVVLIDSNGKLLKIAASSLQTTTLDWTAITNKPALFEPSAHTHLWADIIDKPSIPSAAGNNGWIQYSSNGNFAASSNLQFGGGHIIIDGNVAPGTNNVGVQLGSHIDYKWLQSFDKPLSINPLANNVLIGSITDTGHKLQVAGNVNIKGGELFLTGMPWGSAIWVGDLNGVAPAWRVVAGYDRYNTAYFQIGKFDGDTNANFRMTRMTCEDGQFKRFIIGASNTYAEGKMVIGKIVGLNADAEPTLTYTLDVRGDTSITGSLNVSGHIEVTDATKGAILTSPDGSRWRVTIDNNGALTSTKL